MTKVDRFEQFVKSRYELGDWDDYLLADRSKLVRWKILEACQFSRSSLYQDPVIKDRLSDVEADLRISGVLRECGEARNIVLDESSLLLATAELSGRLDVLEGRMRALVSSVQEVRCQIANFNVE